MSGADATRPLRAAEAAELDQEEATFDHLRNHLDEVSASVEQGEALSSLVDALARMQRDSSQRYRLAAAHVPLLVAHGLSGRPSAGVTVAAAATAIYIGADSLDDLLDGDTPKYWSTPPQPAEILATATLLAAAAQLQIARVPGAERAVALQDELGTTLMAMSAGQMEDVAGLETEPTIDAARATAANKSGSMLAGFAALGAIAAGADADDVGRVRRYGNALAIARQITSDVSELLVSPTGPDLRNGVPTVPMAYHLAVLPEHRRTEFRDRLGLAGQRPDAAEDIAQEMLAGRGIQAALVDAELCCASAMGSLAGMELDAVAFCGLKELIEDASTLGYLAKG